MRQYSLIIVPSIETKKKEICENEGKIFIIKTEEEEGITKDEVNQHLYGKREDNIPDVWGDKTSLGECYHLQLTSQIIVDELNIPKEIKLLDGDYIEIYNLNKSEDWIDEENLHEGNHQHKTRLEKLKQIFKIDHLNRQECEQMYNLLEKHSDRFHLDGDEILVTNVTKHMILSIDDHPVSNL